MPGPIKRLPLWRAMSEMNGDTDVVRYTDHLASHAYDEAKERALFEADCPGFKTYVIDSKASRATGHRVEQKSRMFVAWLDCAKSRAKAAGCK